MFKRITICSNLFIAQNLYANISTTVDRQYLHNNISGGKTGKGNSLIHPMVQAAVPLKCQNISNSLYSITLLKE